ncbi:DUF6134 family protein [Olleya sp. ITB9]|uniref:DUF6134 family protein n=1 Tax=Olleya sp. ITB9 TaxID=1715648 RepID=UPI0006D04E4E|nr:DUF6134 family protein [Olleya sp. ITB9]
MRTLILIITSVFLFGFTVFTTPKKNTINFNVVRNNKIIGNLKATKTTTNNSINYQSATTIEAKIIKNIIVKYNYDVTFKSNNLETADVKIIVNNNPHTSTKTKKTDGNYKVLIDGKNEETIDAVINFSTIQLYFNEPINISKCYSEQTGQFNSIIAMGNHVYKKINEKGKAGIFHYTDGLLTKASIDGGLIKFDLIKQ